jgi:hypothetical protein
MRVRRAVGHPHLHHRRPGDPSPAAAGPGREQAQGPVPSGSAAVPLAESGAARGRVLPAADDPRWESVLLHLHQQLRGPAHPLVSPVQGRLAERENQGHPWSGRPRV